jgi:hypothetical protein
MANQPKPPFYFKNYPKILTKKMKTLNLTFSKKFRY